MGTNSRTSEIRFEVKFEEDLQNVESVLET